MQFFKVAKRFEEDEEGAVTVDWVVLTAAIVGLALAVLAAVRAASISLSERISEAIEDVSVGS